VKRTSGCWCTAKVSEIAFNCQDLADSTTTTTTTTVLDPGKLSLAEAEPPAIFVNQRKT
jgi:hypothetical protein